MPMMYKKINDKAQHFCIVCAVCIHVKYLYNLWSLIKLYRHDGLRVFFHNDLRDKHVVYNHLCEKNVMFATTWSPRHPSSFYLDIEISIGGRLTS